MSLAPQDIPSVFVLDEQKLENAESADKQELYLLQWLAQVERECKMADAVSHHRSSLNLDASHETYRIP